MSNTGIQVDDLRHMIKSVLEGLAAGARNGKSMASKDAVSWSCGQSYAKV